MDNQGSDQDIDTTQDDEADTSDQTQNTGDDKSGTESDGSFGNDGSQTSGGRKFKNDNLVRVGMYAPRFDRTRQFGTVAVRAKMADSGVLNLHSSEGNVLLWDYALDAAGFEHGGGQINVQSCNNLFLNVSDDIQATLEGGRMVINSRSANNGTTGSNTLTSHNSAIIDGFGVQIVSDSNDLASCEGTDLVGEVLPADANDTNDSGQCAGDVALNFLSTPQTEINANQVWTYTLDVDAPVNAEMILVEAPRGMRWNSDGTTLEWLVPNTFDGVVDVAVLVHSSCGQAIQRFELSTQKKLLRYAS